MSSDPHPLITRLVVNNYRSLADVDITLMPLTVFVGPNNVGKSNLIDVLRFVRDVVTLGLDAAVLSRDGINAIRRRTSDDAVPDIHIYLYLQADQWVGEYGFTVASERGGEYHVRWEKLTAQHQSGAPVTIEIQDGTSVQLTGGESVSSLGNLIHADSTLRIPVLATLWDGLPKQLMLVLRDMAFYDIGPDTLRRPQRPSVAAPLHDQGYNLASVLQALTHTPAVDAINDALNAIVGGLALGDVSEVGGYLVTSLREQGYPNNGQAHAVELAQQSAGTLRVLGILTALYQEPPRRLLAIEEPELNLHPGALGVLCDVLHEASLRSQVLITTHSPDVLSHFPVDAIRVVEKVAGETTVGVINDVQRQGIVEQLFSAGELMRIEGIRRAMTTA